ncbi:GNAT family N-acetyltransferase [Mumia zhuanghuii]|uniref:GNAT family N-acetyltransferase n=1 Tax=Mumia zhuanghuii TaxID=2585211 RepID=UPI001891A3D8|nr:GNAT family N-acetyltransferase [Mumia zhuanghuii]
MTFPSTSFPDGVPVLTDGRVTLRAHRVDDVAAVVEQCRDPETLRWTTIPLGYDTAMGTGFVTEMVPKGWGSGAEHAFAVEVADAHGSPRYAGTVSLRDAGAGRADIGFVAHPAVRGEGVTTSALQLLLGYGFETLGLHTVIWWADQGNWGSRKVVWRCGFTFGGTVHRWLPERGEYRDGWVATLHRDDERAPLGPWWSLPTLDGEDVVVRPLRASDDERLVEGGNDLDVQRSVPAFPSPYRLEDAAAFRALATDAAAAGTSFSWAVADPRTDVLLGAAAIPHRTDTSAEIGYWLHPDARGHGYARSAVETLVAHAFTPRDMGGLGALRAYVRIDELNDASLAVARAAGFEMSGTERAGQVRRDGTFADMVVFERVNPLIDF